MDLRVDAFETGHHHWTIALIHEHAALDPSGRWVDVRLETRHLAGSIVEARILADRMLDDAIEVHRSRPDFTIRP